MDIVQIILVLIGVVIAGSVFLNKKKETGTTVVTTDTTVQNDQHAHDFMCLVEKWDSLRRCCGEQGLNLDETCEVLNKQLFPLWKNRKPEVKEKANDGSK